MANDLIHCVYVGLPWWLSGKESSCQRRKHKFNPWPWKIPHAAEHLSLCTTTVEPVSKTCEPQLLSPCATTTEAFTSYSLRSVIWEATTMRSLQIIRKSSLHSLQLEKTFMQQQRPSAARKKKHTHTKKSCLCNEAVIKTQQDRVQRTYGMVDTWRFGQSWTYRKERETLCPFSIPWPTRLFMSCTLLFIYLFFYFFSCTLL